MGLTTSARAWQSHHARGLDESLSPCILDALPTKCFAMDLLQAYAPGSRYTLQVTDPITGMMRVTTTSVNVAPVVCTALAAMVRYLTVLLFSAHPAPQMQLEVRSALPNG